MRRIKMSKIEKTLNIDDGKTITKVVDLFKILGDETRTKILYSIKVHELCVNDICTAVSMNKSAVSHQLRILRQSNIVKARKDGKEVYYSLADEHVFLIFKCALEHIEE